MKTLNSVSGGMSSAYVMRHFPADINVFALVLLDNPNFRWMKGKDEKTRQLVSDKIGREFVGTAEFDVIIYTILDLEQITGQEIKFVAGMSWEQLIDNRKGYLPSYKARFCTVDLKIKPIFDYLDNLGVLPITTRIGYRLGEERRRQKMLKRLKPDGFEYFYKRTTQKPNSRYFNREHVQYRTPEFPLIDNNVTHDDIRNYWKTQNVRFADYNNCVFCVNRNPAFLSFMSQHYGYDYSKGIYLENYSKTTAIKYNKNHGATFRPEGTLEKISNFAKQVDLFPEDFNSCDSGYCGV
jgi:hypothetical protein